MIRDREVPSQKELSSYFEELFSSKVPCQKELSSSNEELFPNPVRDHVCDKGGGGKKIRNASMLSGPAVPGCC